MNLDALGFSDLTATLYDVEERIRNKSDDLEYLTRLRDMILFEMRLR